MFDQKINKICFGTTNTNVQWCVLVVVLKIHERTQIKILDLFHSLHNNLANRNTFFKKCGVLNTIFCKPMNGVSTIFCEDLDQIILTQLLQFFSETLKITVTNR